MRRSGQTRTALRRMAPLWLAVAALAASVAHADAQRLTLPHGDVYEGEVRNGARSGPGTYLWRDGHRYTGEFRDNRLHGQGTYFWPDGRTYTGSFVEDRREGRGVLRWPNGDYYEGEFKNNLLDGQGTFVWLGFFGNSWLKEWMVFVMVMKLFSRRVLQLPEL